MRHGSWHFARRRGWSSVGVEWELRRADVHAERSGPIHLVGRPEGLPFVRDRWAHPVSPGLYTPSGRADRRLTRLGG